jgi:hypothetical protein
MALRVPPSPPPIPVLAEDDGLERVHFRLWLVALTAFTLLAATWLATFGFGPAVLAFVVAKHVLVAFLAMGLGIDAHNSPSS